MITTAVIGASGYSGAELVRRLSAHPRVTIGCAVAMSAAGSRLDEVYPYFTGQSSLKLESFDDVEWKGIDAVFIALPSGEAMKIVRKVLPDVSKIIDLGGDFRLQSVALYKEYYNREHSAQDILTKAVYGLPELNNSSIQSARLIANPGCYPTSAILPLLPLLAEKIIEPKGIVINSLSGVSGAGRSSSFDMSFAEINENIRSYKIGTHQHIPEIETVLAKVTDEPVSVSFIPHLVPITRGIYTTICASVRKIMTEEELTSIISDYYGSAPFIRVRSRIPQLSDVLNTNFCDIKATPEPRTGNVILTSVIDNLVKGAVGQAIQNMNLMFGFPETEGLLPRKDHAYVH